MAQTNVNDYGFKLPVAQAGQLVDISQNYRIDSFAAEAAVAIGQAVQRGTAPADQCAPIDNAADVFLGVAVFSHTREQDFTRDVGSAGAQYRINETVSVLREGRVYVELAAAADVAPGNLAYVLPASGLFTEVALNSVGPVGRFEDAGVAGDLVRVDILREISAPA